MDCEVLYKAMLRYDDLMQDELGWSFLKNNVLTGTSMAEKIFFGKYYKGGLYTMTDDMATYCRRAYKGGLTDTFRTGIFDRVISCDINSSYPHQMTKAPLPVGKSFMITINRPYSGEPLLEGIYRVVVKSTPMNLLYPCLGDIIDGKLCFSHWQNHEMSITKEELVYAFGEGYQFHILDACVCERTADIYHDYIFGAYEERRELKKKMAQAKQDGDMAAYTKYNIAQET
jgi:DNA polymerase elongation subunit (family B)